MIVYPLFQYILTIVGYGDYIYEIILHTFELKFIII